MALVLPTYTALPDWVRKITMNFGPSFAEFAPSPPLRPPSISTFTFEEMSSTLTITGASKGLTTVSAYVSGGSVGMTYELKSKVTLTTGVRLSFPGYYQVIDYPDVDGLETVDHLIDPTDDTTWERDLIFDFGNTFSEFGQASPPTIETAAFFGQTGVVNSSAVASAALVAVRVYCTTPGLYLLRCQATLTDGSVLSIPMNLNAYLGGW